LRVENEQSDVDILHQKDQPFQNKVANLGVNLAFVKSSQEWLDCVSLIQYRERRKLQQPPEVPDRPSQLPTLQIVADCEIQRGDMPRELAMKLIGQDASEPETFQIRY
jgi:hypothetical protein